MQKGVGSGRLGVSSGAGLVFHLYQFTLPLGMKAPSRIW
jgi:hypothetical protein